MKNPILGLVKFFKEEEHADQFIKGKLYLNRLSCFKKIEESEDGARSDKHEAVAKWFQPNNFSMTFPSHPELDIHPADLAGPVSMSLDLHNHLHVLCLYAIHTGRFECIDGLIDHSEEEELELKKQLEIHEDCLNFGTHAVVIINPLDFINRATNAIARAGYLVMAKLVDYYDPASFHGEFPKYEIPFNKQNKSCYQSEYRIVVDTGTHGQNPITIEIGDLSDIAAKYDAKSLCNIKLNSIKAQA